MNCQGLLFFKRKVCKLNNFYFLFFILERSHDLTIRQRKLDLR